MMQETAPKYKYLIETVSNCVRGLKVGVTRSPYALDDINYEL